MSPWNQATGIDIPFFNWMSLPEQESEMRHYAQAMAFKNASVQLKWYKSNVPIDKVLKGKLDSDDVLLVDVGGNIGGQLRDFHASHPTIPGRLILQDLPELLEKLDHETLKSIEVVPRDFMKPQPVVGARAYVLRNVLHDWPDAYCQRILKMLVPAMTPGYSKISSMR